MSLLASKDGIDLFIGLLIHMGAMCPKCGHGTRATSEHWSRCKKCGERVSRKPLSDIKPPQNNDVKLTGKQG